MLYDNALLLRVYTQLWWLTGDPMAARVAHATARFLVRDLYLSGGGFAASLAAHTGGVEGATYLWTPAQLRVALGEDMEFAADLFDVTDRGTFQNGASVLRLARDIEAAPESVLRRWSSIRDRLLAVRNGRPQPTLDDTVVTAWNGLAVTALAEYESYLDGSIPAGVAEATRATAAYLAHRHLVDGRLHRVSRNGVLGEPRGVLVDYGCVAEAFTAMHQLTGDGRWLTTAGVLVDTAVARFANGSGGFYDTADDSEALVVRPADPTDHATPSGQAAMAAALLAYSALTGRTQMRDAAAQALEWLASVIGKDVSLAGYAAATAETLVRVPFSIAIATTDPDAELVRVARRLGPPGAVVVSGAPDAPGVPLLAGRSMLSGRATAYVCRGPVCDRPVTTVDELVDVLHSAAAGGELTQSQHAQ